MPNQKQKGNLPSVHRKRQGLHHKQSNRYKKVYWPYVPILLIVLLGLFIGNWHPTSRHGVLSYATNMSIDSLLDSTNQQRSANGEHSLKLNAQLTAAAQAKANDMTARNYWSHVTPEGKEPWAFVQNAGYHYLKAGENLAYGFNSGNDTIGGWMNSPSHRENLLDSSYTDVGFGFANAKDFNHSGPETVVVAMYGEPSTAGAAAAQPANPPTNANVTPVNSVLPLKAEKTVAIARLQALTKGQLPWLTFGVGIASGAIVVFLLLKHGLALRKLAVEGEEFFIHHPTLDIALVTLVMIGYVLSQSVGVIR